MNLRIEGGRVLTPAGWLADGRVVVRDGRFAAVGGDAAVSTAADGAETAVLDASGLLVVPGFIDLQLNGGFGDDFTQEPASIWPVAARLPRYGVTGFLPTIITAPAERVRAAQAVLRQGAPDGWRGARPLGLHVEGPFLNPAKKGAHNPAYLRPPSLEAAADWAPETGVRLVTLAPELPGALALIRALAARGVVVSAGHSAATLAEAADGLAAGVRYGTHLFNAMTGLHHREPGVAGALLADERAALGLIADGVHVHPTLAALVWRLAGERLTLVSDAMAALGMPSGRYRLHDQEVVVDGLAPRLADGTLAGSALPLDQAVRNLRAWTGCAPEAALAAVTATPARLLGLETGRIAPGLAADFVMLTPELDVVCTAVAGEVVYRRDAETDASLSGNS